MKRRTPSNNTAFLDFLFLLMLFFAILFAVTVQHMNPVREEEKFDPKAEFLIRMVWPIESADDIDIYVQDPVNNLLFFSRRDVGIMHLDRDDLGLLNDVVIGLNGERIVGPNQEIVAIRGILPGEYIVNTHLFGKRTAFGLPVPEGDKRPIPVTLTLIKVNPYKEILTTTVILTSEGQEITVFRFIVGDKGIILETNKLPKSLIQSHLNYYPDEGD